MAAASFTELTDTAGPARPQLSSYEKHKQAKALKEEGNVHFKQKDYRNAMKKYHTSLLYIKGLTNQPSVFGSTSREDVSDKLKKEIEQVMFNCYNNLAVCHLKEGRWQKVIDNSTKALELYPGNSKALFRRGQAHLSMKDYDRAGQDLTEASALEPNDADIKKMLARLDECLKKLKEKERETYRGMFDKLSVYTKEESL